MKNDELKYTKKSLWGELNALSGVALAVIAGIVILSIAAFIFMNRIPPKRTKIIDDAGIFSSEEYADLEDAAEKLKDDNDINVVVVTTRDNPNGTDDSDCRKYAANVYKKYCIHTSMQDNSGICILIDLTLDFRADAISGCTHTARRTSPWTAMNVTGSSVHTGRNWVTGSITLRSAGSSVNSPIRIITPRD
ncbi:MAG: TPM domain-containing protein [Clostridiales bacterium]|nr:TPM domain-containing protein [Clostridiales bacterium]